MYIPLWCPEGFWLRRHAPKWLSAWSYFQALDDGENERRGNLHDLLTNPKNAYIKIVAYDYEPCEAHLFAQNYKGDTREHVHFRPDQSAEFVDEILQGDFELLEQRVEDGKVILKFGHVGHALTTADQLTDWLWRQQRILNKGETA